MKDPDLKGHLIIDPEAAQVVREIFALYLQGNGKQSIARILNSRGVPNPTEYKRLHGMVRNKNGQNSKLWSYVTISNILTNEVYIGNMIQGKSGIPSYKSQKKVQYPPKQWFVMNRTHEPIIDQSTWDQTQAMVSRKATPFRKEPEGIFAKKVRCIHCGCRMQSVKNGDKRAFKCNNHALSSDACVGAYISLPKLERIVVAQLQLLSDELLDKNQLVDGIDPFPDLREMKFKLEAEILGLQKRIEEDHTAMRTLYLDKLRGKITDEEYARLLLQISEEKDTYGKQIAEFTGQIGEIEKNWLFTRIDIFSSISISEPGI